jgi:hypothetical protein
MKKKIENNEKELKSKTYTPDVSFEHVPTNIGFSTSKEDQDYRNKMKDNAVFIKSKDVKK